MPRGDSIKPYRYKPGQCGNPKGRPKDLLGRKMRMLTAEEFAEIANLILKGSITELKKITANPEDTPLRIMIASTAIRIINKGDMNALDTLLNRLIGKVKDHIHHTGVPEQSVMVMLPPKRKAEEEE